MRQGLRISQDSYLIKKLEEFYWHRTRPQGNGAVSDGLASVVEYERWRVSRDEGHPVAQILEDIRAYNQVDVESTLALHDWLEQRRDELLRQGHAVDRPTEAAEQPISDSERAEIALVQGLLAQAEQHRSSVQCDCGHHSSSASCALAQAALLLAGCVGWHRREDRPDWWAYFHYGDLDPEELIESPGSIGGLGTPCETGAVKQSLGWRAARCSRFRVRPVRARPTPALRSSGGCSTTARRSGSPVRVATDKEQVAQALASGETRLVGGTAWLWAREELALAVDVLVTDEAGQFSLANAVAVAQAATSLVLLGDPQQLHQPTTALHPFGAGLSVLEHLIGAHDVIPPDRGVFLDHTYRMHAELTAFVSELAYEGQLASAAPDDQQDLRRVKVNASHSHGPLTGTGLRFLPVTHRHLATQSSVEEAVVVRAVVDDLFAGQ